MENPTLEEKTMLDNIIDFINLQIERRNVSQGELSALSGVPQSSLSIILGKKRAFNIITLLKISNALGISWVGKLEQKK